MKISDDVYYRVLEIATALLNAIESFDEAAAAQQYTQLSELQQAETAAGRSHPFLLETLADLTDDDATAIDLYQQGLELASAPDAAKYRISIHQALAERYRDMGDEELAEQHALRAEQQK